MCGLCRDQPPPLIALLILSWSFRSIENEPPIALPWRAPSASCLNRPEFTYCLFKIFLFFRCEAICPKLNGDRAVTNFAWIISTIIVSPGWLRLIRIGLKTSAFSNHFNLRYILYKVPVCSPHTYLFKNKIQLALDDLFWSCFSFKFYQQSNSFS